MNSFLLTTDDPLLALTSHAEGHTFTVENISGIGLHLPPQLSQKGNRSRRFGFATPLSASHQIGSPAAQIEIVCRDGIAVARKASEAKELPVILVVDVDALQLIDASLGPLGESFPLRDAILHVRYPVPREIA